jgi:tetratricopeptide (TPR) repeat protein
MKKLFIPVCALMFLLFSVMFVRAQNGAGASSMQFRSCMGSIQSSIDEQIRYNHALRYFSTLHCTTWQLQDACHYLKNDLNKFNLCVAAYPNIIDHQNFFNIYDSFSQFSFVMRLYHNTQERDDIMYLENTYQLDGANDIDTKFDLLLAKGDLLLASNRFDEAIDAYAEAMGLKPGNNITQQKIIEVNNRRVELATSLQEEKNREQMFYTLLRKGDTKLITSQFDEAISFYEQAMNIMPGNQMAYQKIKEANRLKEEQVPLTGIDCQTDGNEFSHIIAAIKDKRYSSDMIELSKTYITKKCFSIGQYKQIVGLFRNDDYKLDIIKFFYDYMTDRSNMYEFRNEFIYSSTKSKFDEFLISRE